MEQANQLIPTWSTLSDKEKVMGKLAITGGKPVRTKPFADWPVYSRQEERALQKVLASRL